MWLLRENHFRRALFRSYSLSVTHSVVSLITIKERIKDIAQAPYSSDMRAKTPHIFTHFTVDVVVHHSLLSLSLECVCVNFAAIEIAKPTILCV